MMPRSPVSPTGEPWLSDEERAEIRRLYSREEGYLPVSSRFCCGILPVENAANKKALHIRRDGTPLYAERWEGVGMFDAKTKLAWVYLGKDAFQIDMTGKVVRGPVPAFGRGAPFTLHLEA
ncbi:hypothetical protein EBR66_00455 [bacterium]|nr:hypothetical protein [bacterium]